MITYEQVTQAALDHARLAYRAIRREYSDEPEDAARQALEAAEQYMREQGHDWTFGVESVDCDGTDRSMLYLNAGDTYASTICWEAGKFFESSWGDWYEQAEQKHCMEEGTVRCGWCSALTPIVDDDWRTTICEECGNKVSGS